MPGIPLHVAPELCPPKGGVVLGSIRKPTAPVLMPEAAVNKDDCLVLGEDQIGPTGKTLHM